MKGVLLATRKCDDGRTIAEGRAAGKAPGRKPSAIFIQNIVKAAINTIRAEHIDDIVLKFIDLITMLAIFSTHTLYACWNSACSASTKTDVKTKFGFQFGISNFELEFQWAKP
jgi:hypothetical protein